MKADSGHSENDVDNRHTPEPEWYASALDTLPSSNN